MATPVIVKPSVYDFRAIRVERTIHGVGFPSRLVSRPLWGLDRDSVRRETGTPCRGSRSLKPIYEDYDSKICQTTKGWLCWLETRGVRKCRATLLPASFVSESNGDGSTKESIPEGSRVTVKPGGRRTFCRRVDSRRCCAASIQPRTRQRKRRGGCP